MQTYTDEQMIAKSIRTALNNSKLHGGAEAVWQVFVGRKFGANVTYESKNYIYFYIGQTAFLVFKTG